MLQDDLTLIRDRLDSAGTIAVFTHIRPDGDSVGAALALGWALEDEGKKVEFVSEDPIPERFWFLFQFTADGKNPFIPEPVNADCYVVPDISSPDRVGAFFQNHPEIKTDICIDHHVSNTGFSKLKWVEPDTPAACCVLADIMPKMGFTLTKRISSALLCGIITDTNSFSNSDVNTKALRLAADLIDNGAELFKICRTAYKEHSIQEMEYWRIGMNNMHIEGELAWSYILTSERKAAGIESDEDNGFTNYMGNTTGIKTSILFTETNNNSVKISWRSVPGYDVAKVAVSFGGGGHKAASGATVNGAIDTVIRAVIAKTKEMLF